MMTTRWMRNLLLTVSSFALVGALAVPAAAVEPSAGNTIESQELELLARDAKTPAEHANVARHYRLRAEAFEAKATRHEAEARKMSDRTKGHPLSSKWPAMTRNAAAQERQAAMQARRAATESFDLADRHIRLAVEVELAE